MNFKVIKQLYKKEILDVLRDKKTIIMMVIVPLLIYPLMFVGHDVKSDNTDGYTDI